MKAILIIDVDDNTDFTKAKANITMAEDEYGILLGNVRKKWYKDVSLKPLPQKKDTAIDEIGREVMFAEDVGYNRCIDEILEEQE